MNEPKIYKAGIAGHYHDKSHGGIASKEQLTEEIARLKAELAKYEAAVKVEALVGKLGLGSIYVDINDIPKLANICGQTVTVLVMPK